MKKISFWVLIVLFLANILAWSAVFDLAGHKFLEVDFLNVGQGDAALIKTPQGHQVLIDGGPNSSVLEKLGKEMPFWDRTIDLIILSHPEKDHLAGLLEVLKKYQVHYVLWSGVKRDTPEYQEWINLIQKENADIKIVQAGDKIKIGNLEIVVLSPMENSVGQELKDSNDSSVVAKLIFGQNSFLFTGDISEKVEKNLAQEILEINSNVLKISHHGSKYSTIDEFIRAVSPEVAVIEVGENSYGHPTQEVLDRLAKYGIDILRTDQNGDIKIFSDGKNFKF
jgi:competence protein ComEC